MLRHDLDYLIPGTGRQLLVAFPAEFLARRRFHGVAPKGKKAKIHDKVEFTVTHYKMLAAEEF
jgi:hypothetical protein